MIKVIVKNILIIVVAFFINPAFIISQKSDSLICMLNANLKTEEKAKIFHQLAAIYQNSNIDSAILFAQRGKDLAEKANIPLRLGQNQNMLGRLYMLTGNYDSSLFYYSNAVKSFTYAHDSIAISKCYTGLGVVYGIQANYPEAIKMFHKSLDISEKKGYKRGISDCLTNIGIIHKRQSNYDKAIEYYKKSLAIDSLQANKLDLSMNFSNLGSLYLVKKDPINTKYYTKLALKLKNEEGVKQGLTTCYTNLGGAYLLENNYDSALIWFNKAEKLNIESKNNKSLAITYNSIAELYLQQANEKKYQNSEKSFLDSAEINVNRSLKISQEIKLLPTKVVSYSIMTNILIEKSEIKKAREALYTYKLLNDSLYNSEKMKEIEFLEAKYQSEKDKLDIENLKNDKKHINEKLRKQQIILLLSFTLIAMMCIVVYMFYRMYKEKRVKNRLLNEQNQKIKEINKEISKEKKKAEKYAEELEEMNVTREKMYSVIAHDLKNPFNSILGFTQLLTSNWESFSDKERKEMVETIDKASTDTFYLLLNLLEWSRYQSGASRFNPEKFDFCEVIKLSVSFLKSQAKHKNITINYNPQNKIFIFGDIQMISAVIRNITSNAIKFTPQNGNIKIHVSVNEEKISCVIADNGIGMSKETQKSIFKDNKSTSTEGTNNETGTGLGLIICKEFLEKNNGSMKVESKLGQGAKFTIILPSSKI